MRTGYELPLRGAYQVRCPTGNVSNHETAAEALAELQTADRECDCAGGMKHEVVFVVDAERLRKLVARPDPRTRGVQTCSNCGLKGHNARRCPLGSQAAA